MKKLYYSLLMTVSLSATTAFAFDASLMDTASMMRREIQILRSAPPDPRRHLAPSPRLIAGIATIDASTLRCKEIPPSRLGMLPPNEGFICSIYRDALAIVNNRPNP